MEEQPIINTNEGNSMEVKSEEEFTLPLKVIYDLGYEVTLYSTAEGSTARAVTHIYSLEMSNTLWDLNEDADSNEREFPIPSIEDVNPTNELFEKLCSWMEYHRLHQEEHVKFKNETCEKIGDWDRKFLDEIGTDHDLLFSLLLLANYLNVKDLLLLCCKHIARQVINLSEDEVNAHFSISKDKVNESNHIDDDGETKPMEIDSVHSNNNNNNE